MKLAAVYLLVSLSLTACSLSAGQPKVIHVKDYGAKGDGKTNDTESINEALKAAVNKKATLLFENKTYLVNALGLAGTEKNPIEKLGIEGNDAVLKCISTEKNDVLSLKFVDTIRISGLKIIGNMPRQPSGNGIGIYRSKDVFISKCEISNCKYSGILIGWVKSGTIDNNKVHNNGDGTWPSDGIAIHSMQSGEITNNLVYGNNPKPSHDGDGIQVGQSQYSTKGYYNLNDEGYILIKNNTCYNHGRRGIKVQRSKVTVQNNLSKDNLVGVLIARPTKVSGVQIIGNEIQNCSKGIATDGASKINVNDLLIKGNRLLSNKLDMEIKDCENVTIENNLIYPGKLQNKKINIDITTNAKNINISSTQKLSIRGKKNQFQFTRKNK